MIRRIRRQEEFKIPLCNLNGKNLNLKSCKTSLTELICENSQQHKNVDCFCKRAPPQMFNWILNVDLTRGVVNVGCGWNLSAWNSCQQAGVQGSGWDLIKLSEIFWWYGNPTCSDSIGSNQIEKDQAHVSPRPVWEKRGSLSNLCRHLTNANMIADVKSKIIVSRLHAFCRHDFFLPLQIYQNKTREKFLYPSK